MAFLSCVTPADRHTHLFTLQPAGRGQVESLWCLASLVKPIRAFLNVGGPLFLESVSRVSTIRTPDVQKLESPLRERDGAVS